MVAQICGRASSNPEHIAVTVLFGATSLFVEVVPLHAGSERATPPDTPANTWRGLSPCNEEPEGHSLIAQHGF